MWPPPRLELAGNDSALDDSVRETLGAATLRAIPPSNRLMAETYAFVRQPSTDDLVIGWPRTCPMARRAGLVPRRCRRPTSSLRSNSPSRSSRGFEVAGLGQLEGHGVELLLQRARGVTQDVEGGLRGEAEPFRQDPLGLPDDIPGQQGLVQVVRHVLQVNSTEYGQLSDGDRGQLIHQGTRYEGFTRAIVHLG